MSVMSERKEFSLYTPVTLKPLNAGMPSPSLRQLLGLFAVANQRAGFTSVSSEAEGSRFQLPFWQCTNRIQGASVDFVHVSCTPSSRARIRPLLLNESSVVNLG